MEQDDLGAVAEAFGVGVPTAWELAARGAMGEVWRVEVAGGPPVAVKALFSWADVPDRPADVDLQLAASAAGVPLPRPLLDPHGAAAVTVAGRRWRAYEWVELGPKLRGPVSVDLAGEAGAHLGRIHALGLRPGPGVPAGTAGEAVDPVDRWYREPPAKERLVALARAGTADARHWSYALIASFGLIDELLASVGLSAGSAVAPPSSAAAFEPALVCHRDFSLANVLPRGDGSGLVVIDWENAGALHADQELASALADFCTGEGRLDDASAVAFLEGYRNAGGPARITGGSAFAMAVCTTLNYLAVLADQALSDDPHAESVLGDLLASDLPNLAGVLPALVALAG